MSRTENLAKVKEVLDDVLGIDVEQINEATTFEDLEADSLAMLQLVTAIEDEFNMEVSDEELEKLNSLADVLDLLENK